MENFQEETYGERIAGVYDDFYTGYDETAITVLRELAQGGRALELGIGTGRIALPLQASGVEVSGIDVSEAMLSRLRSKAGGEHLPVTLGNFADVPVDGEFSLVYVLFNTFFGLLAQEEQIRCFQNVARRLSPTGAFVIEAFVPDMKRFEGRQAVRVVQIQMDEVRLDVAQVDPAAQMITTQHLVLEERGMRMYPVKLRYAWPAELDLMARLSGMQLRERWAGWNKGAFGPESGRHISVYERAA